MKGSGIAIGLALVLLMNSAFASHSADIDGVGTVTRIIDGDTFDVSPEGRVRLADVDTPDRGYAGYYEATQALSVLISGETVYLDIDDFERTDGFGRLVSVVYARENSTHLKNVNKAMLELGYAVVDDFKNNEFDPGAWTLFSYHPEDETSTKTDGVSIPWSLLMFAVLASIVVVAIVIVVVATRNRT